MNNKKISYDINSTHTIKVQIFAFEKEKTPRF